MSRDILLVFRDPLHISETIRSDMKVVRRLIVNKQIWVAESKYGVTVDHLFTDREGVK